VLDTDCASQACNTDGTCVDPSAIAYVATDGSDAASCSQMTPCSLTHGISLGRKYTVLAMGTYQTTANLTITGSRWVIGVGNPTINRVTNPGSVIIVGIATDLHLSNLTVTGGINSSSTSFDGMGIQCPNDQTARTLELTNVTVTTNGGYGVDASSCAVTVSRSTFSYNGGEQIGAGYGIYTKDYNATVDRSAFVHNTGDGLYFDGGTSMVVTNSFFTDNRGTAIDTNASLGTISFCTFVENLNAGNIGVPNFDLSNNLFANNAHPVVCQGGCVTAGTITLGADVSAAHFKSATDFHITTGSIAIDAAAASTMDHDYDGDTRPLGNGRDVGADEAQ
jgi:hypothetical protein